MSEKKEYICDICGKVCKSGAGFAKHYTTHEIDDLKKSDIDWSNIDEKISKKLEIKSCGHMGLPKELCQYNCPNSTKSYFEKEQK